MSVDNHSVWCLPRGHIVWTLLKLHHLFIAERGAVVNQCHAVEGLTVGTNCWLSDSSSVYLHGFRLVTDAAFEEGLSHFWDEWRGADDHSTDGDQLVNVLWIQHSHVLCLLNIVRTNLLVLVRIYNNYYTSAISHPYVYISLASHTLYHCKKEGLVTLRTASCAGGMQLLHAIA